MTTQDTIYPPTDAQQQRKPSSTARSMADAIESAGPELRQKLQEVLDGSQARVKEWQGGIQEGIREKPIQSVLIAVAVGAVLGLIVGRRS